MIHPTALFVHRLHDTRAGCDSLAAAGGGSGPRIPGGHRLTETAYIRRVHTAGGLMPTTGCARAADVGKRGSVPYTADYVFYKATGRM
jgi:hypothetical protein